MEIIHATKGPSLEEMREYFVNPDDPQSAEDLARLGANSIKAMAQIYVAGGNIEAMSPDIKDWLSCPSNSKSDLEKVMAEMLKRESTTRRFDHRFMGQIHPQGSKIGILGNLVAAYMNTNRVFSGVSKPEAEMEKESIVWLSEMFGLDPELSGGNITTGGTTANIEALWIARNKKLAEMKTNLRKNEKPLYIFVSNWRHYSIDKACSILGLRLVTVPSIGFKIDTGALKQRVERIERAGGEIAAIVGIAGETETGMIENLGKLADIAFEHDAFFHVDAAYGGPFILTDRAEKFSGIERADSITVDPHKMLYTSYPAGCLLLKDNNDHAYIAKDHTTRYLRAVTPRVEGSMSSAGAISTWATKELLGDKGIAALLNHTLALTQFAYEEISKSDILRPVFEPELNTILVGLNEKLELSPGKTREVLKLVEDQANEQKPKASYISRNEDIDNGKDALRFIAVHPFTTESDIKALLTQVEDRIRTELKKHNDNRID
ncbi:MAG: pyridoxal-dependent decarboxylase [Patescibacteria group bacterium]